MNVPSVDTTIVVPTFNEGANVSELTRRLDRACEGMAVEILFVDDSTDETPAVISSLAGNSLVPIRLIHRCGEDRVGGLAGAVARGVREAKGSWIVVMDGDLQHPPEMVPLLRQAAGTGDTDVVVASRYRETGEASGLDGWWRRSVSTVSTLMARAVFPRRVGRHCTDPMTGFFCVRKSAVRLDTLKPRGFKILLEILARHDLKVRELPFTFGDRQQGESKASWTQGAQFLRQLLDLRFGRMWGFGVVGASGLVLNLALMAAFIGWGMHYMFAAVLATEITIVTNFLLAERYVFADLRASSRGAMTRAGQSILFNNLENLLRLPFLVALVEFLAVSEVLAQGLTIAGAFVGRFFFTSRVVYRAKAPRQVAFGDEAEAA